MVFRVYVEKKPGFDVAAQQLANELRTILGIEALKNVRLVNRYDVEGVSRPLFDQAAVGASGFSSSSAMPWPPPMQAEATP